MRTFLSSIVLLLGVAAVGAAVAFVKYQALNTPPPPNEEFPTQVFFGAAVPVDLKQTASAIGSVVAPRSVQLRTEVVGKVSVVGFTSGDLVKPGQLLLQLDTSVEEAMLDSAKAAQRMAKSTYRRIKQASDARALTELELEQAEAQLAQSEAESARIEAIIRKKTLLAPFEARAGVFDIHPGQYLQEGSLVTMLQGVDKYLFVDFMMPQSVADEMRVGDWVRLQSVPEPISAEIVAVDSQVDKISRSLMARAKVDHPPPGMQINDSVRVELEYGNVLTSVSVPVSALRTSPSGAFVYVVWSDPSDGNKQKARLKMVVPGRSVGDRVVILSGLEPGETVVSDGSFKINDGSWVVDANAASAPAGG